MGDYTEISVGRGSKATHSVAVKAGDPVAWHILVAGDGLDVGLEVTFRQGGGGTPVSVQGSARVSNDGGAFKAPASGSLEFGLDNSFSLLRGKTVRISVLVGRVDPDSLTLPPAAIYDSDAMNDRVVRGVDLFFFNRFGDAERYFAPLKDKVPVFALSYATMAFMRALMTFEAGEIAEATARLKATQTLAETWMPKDSGVLASLRGMVGVGGGGGSGAGGALTPTQLEGTLVYGEATLLLALTNLMEESILALVRTGLAIRSGWRQYVTCDKALGGIVSAIKDGPELIPPPHVTADATPDATSTPVVTSPPPAGTTTITVESVFPPGAGAATAAAAATGLAARASTHVLGGVEFGMGVFNCVASVLPTIILRIIAVLGFPCDRQAGMAQLREAMRCGGVRGPLAALMILAMRVLLPSFHSGDVTQHVPEAEAVLAVMLGRYGDSALFLWMAGRLARMQGNVEVAKQRLLRCAASQTEWIQLAHLCAYELAWCHAFGHEWKATHAHFARLQVENTWSKTFYCYMQGVAMLQLGRIAQARALMVSVLRISAQARKLGNKVISAEQFAVRRAAEYVALTLPPEGWQEDDADIKALIAPYGIGPAVRVPVAVTPGSPAHAACLAFPLPLPGLETVYLFNGCSQMDAPALHASVAQIDAVLAAVTEGAVFDRTKASGSSASWPAAGGVRSSDLTEEDDAQDKESSKTEGEGSSSGASAADPLRWSAWRDGNAGSPPERRPPATSPATPEALRAHFDAAAAAVVRGMPDAGSGSAGGGSGGFGLGRLLAGSGGSGLPAYAKPLPLLPAHVVAVAAVARGALCASLGRADEAAACYQWVIAAGAGGDERAAAINRRELQAVAYAQYEMGVLYADAVKAMGRAAGKQQQQKGAAVAGAAASSSEAAAASAAPGGAPPSLRRPHHYHGSGETGTGILSSDLLSELDIKGAVKASKQYLKAARDIKDDYNWKVRLHIRAHLSMDELRSRPGKRAGHNGGAGGDASGGAAWGANAQTEDAVAAAAAAAEAAEEEEDEDEDEATDASFGGETLSAGQLAAGGDAVASDTAGVAAGAAGGKA